jgi:hypothetical protein
MQMNISLPRGIDDYVDAPLEFFDLLDDLIPTEVCHYTSKETAMKHILESKKIRLGRLGLTNDPRESKRWIVPNVVWGDELTKEGEKEVAESTLMIDQEVNRILQEEWRVLCTVSHNYPYSDSYEGKKEYDHHDYGFSHSRMWAQYANNHSGVCLLFDGKKLDDNIHQYFDLTGAHCPIFHGFVRYDYNESAKITPTHSDLEFQHEKPIERIRKTLIRHYEPNFLYKSPEWKSEHQYRWLVHSTDPSDVLIPIENAIKAVIVGADFPKVYEVSLRDLCKKLKIPAGRICWENGRPYVERYKIYKP